MAVLICKNIETEGPGTIQDFLEREKIQYNILELARGEVITNTERYDTLVIMGGPMSVNEDVDYPYIMKEQELVRAFVSRNKQILGICLGAQIMAKALGARVYVGARQEVGWHGIDLTSEALRDRHMMQLALHPRVRDIWKKFKVFHWHGETFDIPSGAVRLACSDLYFNQAFRYGTNAYAFQFHIEVKKEMILEWLKDEPDFQQIERETETFFEEYRGRAENFYKIFFS
ncbi:MAG: type 1 glutamine amidotransferase [Nitrospirae bacterium]|nr:type 1 glutamine amidotransferase [Nitrospirota bacterium]